GMDYIPESQFRLRLERSDAWRKLAAVLDRRRLAEYEDYLTRYFTEIGLVATEEFARRSRVRTVIAGLLLAVLVNADAFDLLNAYMTDEALRREIVARQDEILGEADFGPADVEGASRRAEMLGSRADSALARAQSQVAAIAASPLLDQSGRDAVLGLAESLAAVRTDVQA